MMGTLAGILNMYWAMVWYYILKLPYGIRIMAALALAYIGIRVMVFVVYHVGKGLVLPLLFLFFNFFIRILQRILLVFAKAFPGLEERAGQADDCLNTWGIGVEHCHNWLKTYHGEHLKKIPFGKIFIIFWVITCVFIILPYYIKPMVSGNAGDICSDINRKSQEIQNHIGRYMDQYYTPAIRTVEEKAQIESSVHKEPIILHLGSDGIGGANLRSSPEKKKGNIIKAVHGNVSLIYENEVHKNGNTLWIKVSTEDADQGWISAKLIDSEDLRLGGIE